MIVKQTKDDLTAIDASGNLPYTVNMPRAAPKGERLEARVSAQLKERILLAATIEGKDLTEFYVDKLSKAADQVIAEHASWKLSQLDSEAFVNALLAPAPPAPRLVDSIRRYRAKMGL